MLDCVFGFPIRCIAPHSGQTGLPSLEVATGDIWPSEVVTRTPNAPLPEVDEMLGRKTHQKQKLPALLKRRWKALPILSA